MPGHPYAMATSASASVQFPMPSTGREPLHAIWESDTASINQDLPNPYDRFQRPPHPQQHPAGPAYQIAPRPSPVPSASRPHTYYAASPNHVASPAPGPSVRSPRSMVNMGASHGRTLSTAAAGGDYFSHMPVVPFPHPQRAAPLLRHAQSSPPPILHRPHLSQSPIHPKAAHSFPAPTPAPRHIAPYPYARPAPTPVPSPYATPHAHHTLPTASKHRHVDSAPHITPYPTLSSPKPDLPLKPSEDEGLRQAVQASLQESRTPSRYDEDAALAQALKQSLVDVGRPPSPPRRPPSSIAPSSSGHSTVSSSAASSSRMASPFASPRPSSSVPHLAFFPGHRSRGSSAAATPLTSPNPGTPGSTFDTAQALRMRSTSIETVLPKDVRQRSENANRAKALPHSAPPTERIPHASPGGQQHSSHRTARSKSDLGHLPQNGRRLSVAVGPPIREAPRAGEPNLTPIMDTPVVQSPSPRREEAEVAPPSYTSSHSFSENVDEKHAPLSAVSANESDSSCMSSAHQQLIPQELLAGISMGFGTAPIISADVPYKGAIPTLISLPNADKSPFYIQAPNWRSLLKFMARLPATRVEPSIDVLKKIKGEATLRIIVSFVKVHSTSSQWLTAVYMSIDVPVPVNTPNAVRFRNGDSTVLPWSYTICPLPAVLRDGADAPISKYYTIPSVPGNLYPTLPTTFPGLAMYLASALELARSGPAEGYPGLRRLSKLVDTLYPEDRSEMDADEKPGMRQKLKNFVGLGSKPQRSRNAEMYDLVTPFVPDDYGR